MKTRITLSTWLVLLLTSLCTPTYAQFSGSGSGSSTDPYIITNGDELNQVRNFLNNGNVYFKMLNDVDLTQWIAENNPTQGWLPIGNGRENSFWGYFDGNGCKIIGLKIKRPSTDFVGLFGYLGYVWSSKINNLSIIQCEVSGRNQVGILAGTIGSGIEINNITILGNVQGNNFLGLLSGNFENLSGKSLLFKNITVQGDVTGNDYVSLFVGKISFLLQFEGSNFRNLILS
jgi:hypothetical protein